MHDTVRSHEPLSPPRGRVVLAHDWLCGVRGGEHVLDRLARVISAHAEIVALLVMFDDGRPLTPALDRLPRVVSGVGRVPLASGRLRRWLLPVYPAIVDDLGERLAGIHNRTPIDLVVSTSSAAIKNLAAPPGVPHVCYVHTPPRYVWSQGAEYEREGGLRALGLRLVRERYKEWDRAGTAHVTRMVANSAHTAALVRACYGVEARVIWPPVRTTMFAGGGGVRDGSWLVVSALEPYKRVDLAVRAANRAGKKLIVVGEGSEGKRLRAMAGPTVRFAGRVADADLAGHIAAASVLIFPQVEDFGIVAAEALASGLPVVARRAGGAMEIVEEGVTGAFFDQATEESLLEAVARCPRGGDDACRRAAERFSEARFDREVLGLLRPYLPGQRDGPGRSDGPAESYLPS